MIPGEIITAPGEIEINAGRTAITVTVANTGDRPIQVGSHYHFAETNPALQFDRDAGARPSARHRRRHGGALRARPDARGAAGAVRRQARGLRLPRSRDGEVVMRIRAGAFLVAFVLRNRAGRSRLRRIRRRS